MDFFRLYIKATVKPPISVIPKHLIIKGKTGDKINRKIEIVARKEKPLEIKVERFELGDGFTWQLEEVEKQKKYSINITGKLDKVGIQRGIIKLGTNYPEKPVLNIWYNVRTFTREPEAH